MGNGKHRDICAERGQLQKMTAVCISVVGVRMGAWSDSGESQSDLLMELMWEVKFGERSNPRQCQD